VRQTVPIARTEKPQKKTPRKKRRIASFWSRAESSNKSAVDRARCTYREAIEEEDIQQ